MLQISIKWPSVLWKCTNGGGPHLLPSANVSILVQNHTIRIITTNITICTTTNIFIKITSEIKRFFRAQLMRRGTPNKTLSKYSRNLVDEILIRRLVKFCKVTVLAVQGNPFSSENVSCQILHGSVKKWPGIHPVVDDWVDTGVGHRQPVKLQQQLFR